MQAHGRWLYRGNHGFDKQVTSIDFKKKIIILLRISTPQTKSSLVSGHTRLTCSTQMHSIDTIHILIWVIVSHKV